MLFTLQEIQIAQYALKPFLPMTLIHIVIAYCCAGLEARDQLLELIRKSFSICIGGYRYTFCFRNEIEDYIDIKIGYSDPPNQRKSHKPYSCNCWVNTRNETMTDLWQFIQHENIKFLKFNLYDTQLREIIRKRIRFRFLF